QAAAAAAGLTETELTALEESGKFVKPPNFAALGSLLHLDAGKLESIASGWLPSEKDLGTWRELRRSQTDQGRNTVNCYIVWAEGSRDAALLDPGWTAEPVIRLIEESHLQLRHIFLTHTHEDHIAGLNALREKFPKAHLHSSTKSAPPQQRNRANDFI